MCTYLWPDNGDMRPSFRFLGYVPLFYPLLLESEHFSYGRTLICQTYYTYTHFNVPIYLGTLKIVGKIRKWSHNLSILQFGDFMVILFVSFKKTHLDANCVCNSIMIFHTKDFLRQWTQAWQMPGTYLHSVMKMNFNY